MAIPAFPQAKIRRPLKSPGRPARASRRDGARLRLPLPSAPADHKPWTWFVPLCATIRCVSASAAVWTLHATIPLFRPLVAMALASESLSDICPSGASAKARPMACSAGYAAGRTRDAWPDAYPSWPEPRPPPVDRPAQPQRQYARRRCGWRSRPWYSCDRLLTARNLLPEMVTQAPFSATIRRHNFTNLAQLRRMPGPLSHRKLAMVL